MEIKIVLKNKNPILYDNSTINLFNQSIILKSLKTQYLQRI